MSLQALKTKLLNTTPFMDLGAELRPIPPEPIRKPCEVKR